MRPELFTIGPVTVYGYGLMLALGVVCAVFLADNRAKRLDLSSEAVYSLGILCAVFGFIGAKLLYLILHLSDIMEDPSWIFTALSQGFVVYGGIIAGILAGIGYCRYQKLPSARYFDLIMPSIALAQGFGRIGCFLAGCCYGRETDAWYGVIFASNSCAPSGVRVIPTQLISSGLDFVHCFLLLYLAGKIHRDGRIGSLYLILYSSGRFCIEFLRDDARGNIGFLSTSQFISLLILIIGMILWFKPTKISSTEENG